MTSQLSEQYIQDSFHRYLKSSLTQAKLERLLDADLLSSAEGDLMITGPALCLYFAALRCTTNPPSVPLPRASKDSEALDLSVDNCPPAFIGFLQVWARTVPIIQNLPPEQQHDLARVICNLPPVSPNVDETIRGVSADMRAVAIEISQRRSFQDRYASALQAALDSGGPPSSSTSKRASFVPPPTYEASSPATSPRSSLNSLPPSPQHATHDLPPQSPTHLSPFSRAAGSSRSPSPSILTPESPAIEFIRETMYASLADSLERQPHLRRLLTTDPPRAYFASVSFAILDVATTSITPEGHVIGVLGQALTLEECPPPLRPLMKELADIGKAAKEMEQEDTEQAMSYAQQGKEIPPTKMDRVKEYLEAGLSDNDERRRSLQGGAQAFANRLNGLSLNMTRLKAFRDRQDDVFKVLMGIGS